MQAPIRLEGSFYDIGYEMGRRSAAKIRDVLKLVEPRLRQAFDGDTAGVRDAARANARKGAVCFLPSDEYLRGHARGVGIEFDEQVILSFCEEVYEHGLLRMRERSAERRDDPPAPAPARDRDRCSSLAVRAEDGWIGGHEEDYKDAFYDGINIVDFTFKGYPRLIGAGYHGMTPGNVGALNEAGVAVFNDALWCQVWPNFMPKQPPQFEAVLQTTAAGSVARLTRWKPALTDHFLAIDRHQAFSLEVGPSQNMLGESSSLLTLGEGIDTFTHTNLVKRLILQERDPAPPGSRVRQAVLDAIAECEPPRTFEAMLARMMARDGILNRTATHNWTTQPDSVTLASVVAQPAKGRITIVRYRADGTFRVDPFQF